MYDLSSFSLKDMTACGAALRSMGEGATTMEATAERIVQYLYDHLTSGQAEGPACVLVRFFKTHPFGQLGDDLQRFALGMLGQETADPAMRCLTLLATRGSEPAWNSRSLSSGHQAIPLPSPGAVQKIPMISQMIRQFGLEVSAVLEPPETLLLERGETAYNVFFVHEAVGNPYVPAQEEFVVAYGVRSVLGFGGRLPSGDLFAVIVFSRTPISRERAELFRPLALNALLAVLPFDQAVFAPASQPPPKDDLRSLRHRAEAIQQLLSVHETAVLAQADELDRTLKQLQQRAGELARSNEDLEQFAYVASHDLQEPLRAVSGYCQLLKRRYAEQLDADAHEFLDFAVEGAARMQGLIEDLLAYSRVRTQARAFKPVDSQTALDRALSNLKTDLESSGAQVAAGPLPTVAGDLLQLTQLFQNLIGNAVKYRHPDRRPDVRIEAREQEGNWLFAVHDNGIGIEPRHGERIFQVFQRLHTRDQYPGTGIGLAICRKIVERHGGRIWVESEPAAGSTFYFTIPITRREKGDES